ncbi:MAG: hypothetical protein ABI729_01905 [Chitinophagales bacterium]
MSFHWQSVVGVSLTTTLKVGGDANLGQDLSCAQKQLIAFLMKTLTK